MLSHFSLAVTSPLSPSACRFPSTLLLTFAGLCKYSFDQKCLSSGKVFRGHLVPEKVRTEQ